MIYDRIRKDLEITGLGGLEIENTGILDEWCKTYNAKPDPDYLALSRYYELFGEIDITHLDINKVGKQTKEYLRSKNILLNFPEIENKINIETIKDYKNNKSSLSIANFISQKVIEYIIDNEPLEVITNLLFYIEFSDKTKIDLDRVLIKIIERKDFEYFNFLVIRQILRIIPNEEILEKYWDKLGKNKIREVMSNYIGTLSNEFIEKYLDGKVKKITLIEYGKANQDYIESMWRKLKKGHKTLCLERCKIDESFIERHWSEINKIGRLNIIRCKLYTGNIKISSKFLDRYWNYIKQDSLTSQVYDFSVITKNQKRIKEFKEIIKRDLFTV